MIAEPSRLFVCDLLVFGVQVILLCELYVCGVWGERGCGLGLLGPCRVEVLLGLPSVAL